MGNITHLSTISWEVQQNDTVRCKISLSKHNYLPQHSDSKVVFYTCLSFCPQGGAVSQHALGQIPHQACNPPGRPPGQTPPGRHPPGRYPPGRHPQVDTPPSRHPPPLGRHPSGQTPVPTDSYCSRRYASYWNTFLFDIPNTWTIVAIFIFFKLWPFLISEYYTIIWIWIELCCLQAQTVQSVWDNRKFYWREMETYSTGFPERTVQIQRKTLHRGHKFSGSSDIHVENTKIRIIKLSRKKSASPVMQTTDFTTHKPHPFHARACIERRVVA